MPAQSSKKASEIEVKIDEFLEALEIERGTSPLTIRNYRHYLSRFSEWMRKDSKGKLSEIDIEHIRNYRLYLSRFSNAKDQVLSRKTQSYHMIALRSLLRWLIRNDVDVISPDKIDLPKSQSREVQFLSGNQVERILNAPSLSTIQGKRDKAILELFFSTGLRVSELVHLDRDKIDPNSREFGIIGKGGRSRVVFLSRRAGHWLVQYLDAREDHFKPLFIRHRGKIDPSTEDEKVRLSIRSVQRTIKKYARKIKLPVEVTPHVLRHSFATDLLMAGADLRSVQEMLGHKNISTTQIYTHVTNRKLREVHEDYHGKSGN